MQRRVLSAALMIVVLSLALPHTGFDQAQAAKDTIKIRPLVKVACHLHGDAGTAVPMVIKGKVTGHYFHVEAGEDCYAEMVPDSAWLGDPCTCGW